MILESRHFQILRQHVSLYLNIHACGGRNYRCVFDETHDATDKEPIENFDNVQIGDVVVNRVGFMGFQSGLVICQSMVK